MTIEAQGAISTPEKILWYAQKNQEFVVGAMQLKAHLVDLFEDVRPPLVHLSETIWVNKGVYSAIKPGKKHVEGLYRDELGERQSPLRWQEVRLVFIRSSQGDTYAFVNEKHQKRSEPVRARTTHRHQKAITLSMNAKEGHRVPTEGQELIILPEWLRNPAAKGRLFNVATHFLRAHPVDGNVIVLTEVSWVNRGVYRKVQNDPKKNGTIVYKDEAGRRHISTLPFDQLTLIESDHGKRYAFVNPKRGSKAESRITKRPVSRTLERIAELAAQKISPGKDKEGNLRWQKKMYTLENRALGQGATLFAVVYAYFKGTPPSERQDLFDKYWFQMDKLGLTADELGIIKQEFSLSWSVSED